MNIVCCSNGVDWTSISISARCYRSNCLLDRLHDAACPGDFPARRVSLSAGRNGSQPRVSTPHYVRMAPVSALLILPVKCSRLLV